MSGTGIVIQVDDSALTAVAEKLNRLSGRVDFGELLPALGAEIESQTRRRIESEKTSPDGAPWPAWSGEYAQARHGGRSLLVGEGELLDSVQYLVSGDSVQVGSNLVYAAIHQFGGEPVGMGIPERAYLGLSGENQEDLEGIIDDWVQGVVG